MGAMESKQEREREKTEEKKEEKEVGEVAEEEKRKKRRRRTRRNWVREEREWDIDRKCKQIAFLLSQHHTRDERTKARGVNLALREMAYFVALNEFALAGNSAV